MLYWVSYHSLLQCQTPHKPERTPQMLAVWVPQHWLYMFLLGHNLGKPSCWVYLVVASICWWQNQTLQRLDKATFLVVHLFEFMKDEILSENFCFLMKLCEDRSLSLTLYISIIYIHYHINNLELFFNTHVYFSNTLFYRISQHFSTSALPMTYNLLSISKAAEAYLGVGMEGRAFHLLFSTS